MQGVQDEEGLKEGPCPYVFPIFSLLSFLSLYHANNPIPCSQKKRLARYNDKNDKKKFMSLFFPYPAHLAYPPYPVSSFSPSRSELCNGLNDKNDGGENK